MEGLHVAMEDAIAAGFYNGFKIDTLNLSHLFFADDALFIGEWSHNNIKSLVAILDCFYQVSGLKINYHKSKLFGVGVPFEEVTLMASITGCNALVSPFNYLGLPIDCNMALVKSWDPIYDKFSKRLSKWKASLISIGGRATLITSVLGAIGTYFFSLFPMPLLVNKKLESLRSKFFWGSDDKSKKISWNLALASKDKGGLVTVGIMAGILNGFTTFQVKMLGSGLLVPLSSRLKVLVIKLIGVFFLVTVLELDGIDSSQKKINIFIWRSLRDHLPSRWNLSRKGIDVISINCPICDHGIDSAYHTLWVCLLASTVWTRVFNWLDLSPPSISNMLGLYAWIDSLYMSSSKKDILEVVCGVTLWSLWSFRNEVIFGTVRPKRSMLFDKIVDYPFRWYSTRSKLSFISWNNWIQNPLVVYSL
uniref:Reverse transcriptase domain, reverse transcriptase zinc-binding domain protein n=1 Tax=Tanacetum cinerariifolium TaxID=118510 RepID=A0A6L2JC67_TANCI|nr:reverse transcriptase domain, reverse transcriptase zinc-binding domain protein [Tanacetum cinerariifolium]